MQPGPERHQSRIPAFLREPLMGFYLAASLILLAFEGHEVYKFIFNDVYVAEVNLGPLTLQASRERHWSGMTDGNAGAWLEVPSASGDPHFRDHLAAGVYFIWRESATLPELHPFVERQDF